MYQDIHVELAQVGRLTNRLLQWSTLETLNLFAKVAAVEEGMNLPMVIMRRSWHKRSQTHIADMFT